MDEHYWAALRRGEGQAALDRVKRLREEGWSRAEIVDQLVVPAQRQVGELWLTGELSVEDEHRITAINEGLLHWLGSFEPEAGPESPLVVVACLEQERHALPALLVAEDVAAAGYRVRYLGAAPDPDELLHEVLRARPRAVLLSASMTSSLARQKVLFGQLAAVGVPVVVGGQAFGGDGERARALGATAYAATAADAVALVEQLPERLPQGVAAELTPAEEQAAWLEAYREQLVAYVVTGLQRGETPPWAETRDLAEDGVADAERPGADGELAGQVDHVVGCLSAALVTGDETIALEARDWLLSVLEHRGDGADRVRLIWAMLGEPLRGHAEARTLLAAAALPQEPVGREERVSRVEPRPEPQVEVQPVVVRPRRHDDGDQVSA